MTEKQWHHVLWTSDGTKHNFYHNGANTYYNATGGALYATNSTVRIGTTADGGNVWLHGFLDEIMIHKGIFMDANTVIQQYMTGRDGNHLTANSSTVLHIKSDNAYGDTNIVDSSSTGHTITHSTNVANLGNVHHHIDDNRTANTALYFDGYSNITLGEPNGEWDIAASEDFTLEAWIKPDVAIAGADCDIIWTNDSAGTGVGFMCK